MPLYLCAALSPTAQALLQQGREYKKTKKYDVAMSAFQNVLIHNPEHMQAHFELAETLRTLEKFSQAINHYQCVLKKNPRSISALFGLAISCLNIGKIDEAVDAFNHILAIAPNNTSVRYNMAYTLKTGGRIDEAISIYQEIIAQEPNYEPAQLALGFAYITKGDFENGWKQHERYLKKSNKNGDRLRALLRNNLIEEKTILLIPEGGLGDTINFVRYAQLLKNMGANVVVSVQKQLIPLILQCPYIDEVIPSNTTHSLSYHARATLMSMPAIFNDNEKTIPKNIPYIFPEQQLVHFWKKKLAQDTNFKIGICWGASVKNDESRLPIARRSIPLNRFFKLKNIPDINFYSLQKFDGIEELNQVPSDFPLKIFENLDESHGSFMDTVALMQNLDLIISVDSAVAHLAGALGKPVWLLLPFSTDWRWIWGKIDSPWYPTMRIFKQHIPFDWDSVIKEIYESLKEMPCTRNTSSRQTP